MKKVQLNLVGVFRQQAKREDWANKEIEDVLNEAMSGDYQHLLRTILKHCEESNHGDDVCSGCEGDGEVYDSHDQCWYNCWQCDGLG